MTREEAIRLATGLRTDFKCKSETMVDFCNTIIKALEQEPKWIPVSERLPEERKSVLVYAPEYKNIYCAYLDGDTWFIFGGYGSYAVANVIAWMPLPQPYMAESEVKEGE